jgi:TfoX N-terminal domain
VIRSMAELGKKGCAMARNPELEALLQADLASLPDLRTQRMFSGLCWMWRGNLLCGADHQGLLLRLGKDRGADALSEPGVSAMKMGDRLMQGWVRLAPDAAQDTALRHRLLALAQEFVAALPAK